MGRIPAEIHAHLRPLQLLRVFREDPLQGLSHLHQAAGLHT